MISENRGAGSWTLDLNVHLVEAFTLPQQATVTLDDVVLCLNVSGLRHWASPGVERRHPGPLLVLLPQQTRLTFEYGPNREDWVVLFASTDLRRGSQETVVAMRPGPGEAWSEIPSVLEIPPTLLPSLQQEFLQLREAFRSPLERQRLMVQIGVMSLIGRFLTAAPAPTNQDPAARLKRLLDDDPTAKHGIAELSRRCAMSPDHLRQRFLRAYGIVPHAYRQRQRMAEAIRLLSTTDLAVMDIARQLGFRQASHFCEVFRTHCHQTPLACRQRLRYGT